LTGDRANAGANLLRCALNEYVAVSTQAHARSCGTHIGRINAGCTSHPDQPVSVAHREKKLHSAASKCARHGVVPYILNRTDFSWRDMPHAKPPGQPPRAHRRIFQCGRLAEVGGDVRFLVRPRCTICHSSRPMVRVPWTLPRSAIRLCRASGRPEACPHDRTLAQCRNPPAVLGAKPFSSARPIPSAPAAR
jgi:hypothetical protein